ESEPPDHIAFVVIAFEVEPKGNLGNDSEGLQRYVALLQARKIHVPSRAAFQKRTVPQQGIGVKVRDQQLFVKLFCAIRGVIGSARQEANQSSVELTRHYEEEDTQCKQQQRQESVRYFLFHRRSIGAGISTRVPLYRHSSLAAASICAFHFQFAMPAYYG